jgi:acyl carrier protein
MVLEKIKEVLSAQFGIDKDMIDENTDIAGDLGADSLDIVELMMSLEEEFGLTITDEMASDIKTVGDLTSTIEDLVE